jgi:hypothetical protein
VAQAESIHGIRDSALLNISPFGRLQVAEHLDWYGWFAHHDIDLKARSSTAPHFFNANDYNLLIQLALEHQGVALGWHSQARELNWLRRNTPAEANVVITDVTSSMAVISTMGPNARKLLQPLTTDDLSHEGLPFATSREIDLGYARVRASRITYVGELGWELYIPTEFAPDVFDRIVAAGEPLA